MRGSPLVIINYHYFTKGKIAEFFAGGTSIVLSNDDAREKVARFRARTCK